MEQDSYYFRVGVFVTLALIAATVVIGWFAGHRHEELKTTYAIYISGSVDGLTPGAPVRLKGIQVGMVKDISFVPTDNNLIRVMAEIVDTAPIRSDTVAVLQLQGITGTSLIALENGGTDMKPLVKRDDRGYLVIASKPSTLEKAFTTIPALIDQVTQLSKRAQAMLNDDNIAAVHGTLQAINDSATSISKMMGGPNAKSLQATLQSMQATLQELRGLMNDSRGAVAESKTTVREIKMLTRTLRDDPSLLLHGTDQGGVKLP